MHAMDEHPAGSQASDHAGRSAPRSSAPGSSLIERLGLPNLRGRRGLVSAILIDSFGSGIFLPFAVLYATVVARIPIATTGLILSLCAACALPTAPVAGTLVDRFGAQRLVIAAQLIQAAGFAGYPFITTPIALFACGFAVAVGNQAYFAANGAFVAQLAPPDQRARWFALLGACRSAGLGAGAPLSGLALIFARGDGYRLLAGANALSFIVAAALIARVALPEKSGMGVAPTPAGSSGSARSMEDSLLGRVVGVVRAFGGYRPVLRDTPVLGFTATNVAFSLIVISFSIVLPLYILGPLHLPIWAPGAVFGLNTALVVVAQTSFARWIERYRRTRALAFSAGLFAIALLLLSGLAYLSRRAAGLGRWTLLGLVIALLIYTAAELVMAPLKNALIADAAPDALRGRYLAFYHLSWSAASTIGPAALTALFALGAGWVWLALTGVALSALVALCRLDSALPLHAVRASRRNPLYAP